jgi:probable rRNA maturation factor
MESTIIFKRRVSGLSQRALTDFVARASHAAGLKGTGTVMVTHSREIRSLNWRFRGQDYATDVLSFPPPALDNGFAGDIAISLDIAARNARSQGHSLGQEVQILLLHGILHLAGYDHEGDRGEMADKEQRLRRRLKLPTGLIERVQVRPTRSRI